MADIEQLCPRKLEIVTSETSIVELTSSALRFSSSSFEIVKPAKT